MSALDETLHSAQQMVNEQKFVMPPGWHANATEIITIAVLELAAMREALEAAKEAIRQHLEWGPKTQSDRFLCDSDLEKVLAKLDALK